MAEHIMYEELLFCKLILTVKLSCYNTILYSFIHFILQPGGLAPANIPYQPHVMYVEDPVMQPGTPDTPHGETLPGEPWSERDFQAPQGVYGAIGSGVPSMGSQPNPKHQLKLNAHGGGVWSQPFGGNVSQQVGSDDVYTSN